MWDEITYPFPNFNSCTVEVWEWISNFITHKQLCMVMITTALAKRLSNQGSSNSSKIGFDSGFEMEWEGTVLNMTNAKNDYRSYVGLCCLKLPLNSVDTKLTKQAIPKRQVFFSVLEYWHGLKDICTQKHGCLQVNKHIQGSQWYSCEQKNISDDHTNCHHLPN